MEKAKRAIKTSRKFSINCIKATIWIKIWSLGQTKEPKGSTLSSFLHFLDLRMKVFGKSTRGSLMVKQDILMEKNAVFEIVGGGGPRVEISSLENDQWVVTHFFE